MLQPYNHSFGGDKYTLPSSFGGSKPRRGRTRKILQSLACFSLMFLLSSDFIVSPILRELNRARKLCQTYFIGDFSEDPYWENSYPAIHNYPGDPRTLPGGENNIGFVVTLTHCPDDSTYQPGVDTDHDPGHALYEAAAVLKHSIETSLATTGKYNVTMHAIVHPDAIVCTNPNGDPYDRVKVLENLGYYVNIQASPLVNKEEISDETIKNNIDSDVGDRDLTSLYAATYDNHPATVSTNLDTVVMQPLDPILDTFLDDDTAQIAFSTTPVDPSVPPPFSTSNPTAAPVFVPTTPAPSKAPVLTPTQAVDTSLVLMKPDPTLVDNLTDVLLTSTYDPDTGFNDTGIGANSGSLGTQGVLSYYYGAVDPDAAQVLDQCSYGSVNSDDCSGTDTANVAVAQLTECGQPWTCPDLSTMSAAGREKCEAFERFWFESRKDFEDNCWIGGPASSRDGTYQSDVYLGFCNSTGTLNYNRIITDLPAPFSCDPDTQTNSAYNVIAWGNGKFQNQKLSLTTGEYTGQPEVCISGSIAKAGFEPPYNILMVIDVSGSTWDTFGGTPPGDVNGDGNYDSILDAEIGSMIAVLEHIAASGSLGNDNVNIGLVTFSTSATYHGQYTPLDPDDTTKVNPLLKADLLALRSGGYTHFDDALDKSIEFYQEASGGRSNLMFFLSDGIPNVPGDGDNEEPVKYQNNHPSALMYNSELTILDNLNVYRLAVGVGSGSDVRDGFGLDMIDNTPDEETGETAQQVTTTDALTEVLMSNPVVGEVIDFTLEVNGVVVPSLDVSVVSPGPTGFVFGELIVTGLDPFVGAVNRIKVTVTIDYDGIASTSGDGHTIAAENVIVGNLQ